MCTWPDGICTYTVRHRGTCRHAKYVHDETPSKTGLKGMPMYIGMCTNQPLVRGSASIEQGPQTQPKLDSNLDLSKKIPTDIEF